MRFQNGNSGRKSRRSSSEYAELDAGSPLLQKLGPDGVNKLLAKFTGISTVIEQIVRARVTDLSF